MKIDRHGQAKILAQTEIQALFNQGLVNDRDRAYDNVLELHPG